MYTLDEQFVCDGVLAIGILYMASVFASIITRHFTDQQGAFREEAQAFIRCEGFSMNSPSGRGKKRGGDSPLP